MFENPTVNFDALCGSCANIASFSSQFILTSLCTCSNVHNASGKFVSFNYLSVVNFTLHPNPQKKSNGINFVG